MINEKDNSVIYFIADLHLVENRPDITACFLSFLKNDAPNATALYILGDLFESWIGDDDDSEFVLNIAYAIKSLSDKGTKVFFIHGNRDFLLGEKFARKSGMILLPEVDEIVLFGQKTIIMHGDTLCTRDIAYQEFRKKSRTWWWQTMIKSLPLFVRRKIAANYRKKSTEATAMKSQEIMDVTPNAVIETLTAHKSQLMIHGHTHRPYIHDISANNADAKRIVLGDWYDQGAWLKVTPEEMTLLNTPFDPIHSK